MQKNKNINVGASFLFLLFGLLFLIILVRFISIQVSGEVKDVDLNKKVVAKYQKQEILEANRGTIYDKNGKVIAQEAHTYDLIAILDKDYPNRVKDPKDTAVKLANHIKMNEADIYNLLNKKGKFQVEFGSSGKNLSQIEKRKIESLELPGIVFKPSLKRFYPNGIFASHLIGFAERDDKGLSGLMGIEKYFDKDLKGNNGSLTYKSDKWGFLLPNSEENITKPIDGSDIHLTIDKNIQLFLEDSMEEVSLQYKPKKIFAIVSDPKTGKILAMSQRPTFNPNTRDGLQNSWQNEIIESQFEPGSTMKIFSLAAAIEEGVFKPQAKYKSGKFYVGKQPIRDHNNGKGWGNITYLEGVQKSSNVAFALLLEEMGLETFFHYLNDFGFGKPTNINLGNEAEGKILYNYDIEKYTTAFGQGTTVTPLQMMQAMSAIANKDGSMMKPYVVDFINNKSKNEKITNEPIKVGNPITPETAKNVRDVLETVVYSPEGTGTLFKNKEYQIAGKTGTAQIPDPDGKGYLKGYDNYLFSFIGMAPKDDPRLIMYVAVQQPDLNEETYESGAVPVSKVFNPVITNSLKYLNVKTSSNNNEKDIIDVEDYLGEASERVIEKLDSLGLTPVIVGSEDKIISQIPKKGTRILEGEKVFLKTNGKTEIPDLTGWSKKNVIQLAQLANLKVEVKGNGFVQKYNINRKMLTIHLVPPNELHIKDSETAN